MSKRVYLFNNVADGVAMTPANVLSEDGVAADTIATGAGNSINSDAVDMFAGNGCMKQVSPTGSAVMISRFNFANQHKTGRVSIMRKTPSVPASNWQWIQFLDSANALLFRVGIRTDSKLFFSTFIGTNTITFNRYNRYEFVYNQGTSSGNGALTVNAYNGSATGTPDASISATTADLGGAGNKVAKLLLGTSSALAVTQQFDALQMEDLADLSVGSVPSEIGPYVPPLSGAWNLGLIGMGS